MKLKHIKTCYSKRTLKNMESTITLLHYVKSWVINSTK